MSPRAKYLWFSTLRLVLNWNSLLSFAVHLPARRMRITSVRRPECEHKCSKKLTLQFLRGYVLIYFFAHVREVGRTQTANPFQANCISFVPRTPRRYYDFSLAPLAGPVRKSPAFKVSVDKFAMLIGTRYGLDQTQADFYCQKIWNKSEQTCHNRNNLTRTWPKSRQCI